MHIRKKTFIITVTYLAAAVIALGAYTLVHSGLERSYRRTAEYGYAHAFEEVVLAASNLSDALHRASYTAGPELSSAVCADIYGNCLAAGMTMAALPFSTQELEQTAAFIGIAGDYARSVQRQSAESGLDDNARSNFAALYKTAAALTERLGKLQTAVNNGETLMDEPENVFGQSGALVSTAMLEMDARVGDTQLDGYAGRYSRTVSETSAEPMPEAEARRIAADFFGFDPEQLSLAYTSGSGVRCFELDGGSSITVDANGNVLSLSSPRAVTGGMDDAGLTKKAWDFLASHGFENMYLSSTERSGGVMSFVFECMLDNAHCAGDGVRLSIAGDDGEVYAYDAVGHIKNHGTQQRPSSIVDEQTAAAVLPDTLTENGSRMCYAETDGGGSTLCYEFDCTGSNGETLRVLVDAVSGRQYAVIF